MLILSRAEAPITCHAEKLKQVAASPAMQRLTRSLRVTQVSFQLTLLALLGAPASAAAQQPPPGLVEVSDAGNRHGFWAGLGLGAGGESFDLDDGLGYSNAYYKPTVSLRLGGTLSQSFRL